MFMMRGLRTFAGLAALASAMLASPARAGYVFTNFDGPGDITNGTTVNGISNGGAVVGFTTDGNGVDHSFVRNSVGAFNVLSLLPVGAQANGINTLGLVVGGSDANAFIYSNGVTNNLPAVNGTTLSEVAFGINDKGTIVGQFSDSSTGKSPGFIDDNGTFTTLDPKGAAFVNAQGINNNGLVAGFYSDDNLHSHGFLYDSATKAFSFPLDPNVANFEFTQYLGINDKGEVAGYYQTNDGSQHGFLYSIATSTYTFLDDPNAVPGTGITQITGIDNAGEITGFYVDPTAGIARGFIAVPTPEPGSLTLMGLGAVGAVGYCVRRRQAKAA
jgi:probable HAF family extracellular repeat protein